MEIIADILLISGAIGAGIYCLVLSRRLRRFTDLEQGVGGAIAILSVQVDDMTKTLEKARVSAAQSAQSLDNLTVRAESAARRLELLVAAMHDLPEIEEPTEKPSKPEPEVEEPKQGEVAFFLSQRNRLVEAAE